MIKKRKKPNVADINKKNKTANLEAKLTITSTENEASNPFSRRPTAPIILWKTGDNKLQEVKKEDSEKKEIQLRNSSEFLKLSRESSDGEENGMEVDLDIEIDFAPKPVNPFQYLLSNLLRPAHAPPKKKPPSRKLSVDDYKRRRGLL